MEWQSVIRRVVVFAHFDSINVSYVDGVSITYGIPLESNGSTVCNMN